MVAAGTLLMTLGGCGLAGNATHTNLVVDFNDFQAVAARDTVRTQCGTLSGIGVVPPRAKDVSVYFDIQHATSREVNALDSCVNDLQEKNPALGIRGYRITDNTDS
jgi:hypothetical protein